MSAVAVVALVAVGAVLVWAWWVRLAPSGRRRAPRAARRSTADTSGQAPARVWVPLTPPPLESEDWTP